MDFFLALFSGFFLGCLHAFDVDHITAVTAFAANNSRGTSAARFGLFWGLGHTATLFVLGLATVIFKFAIPPLLQSVAEVFVGVLLIVIGIWTLLQVLERRKIHVHRHLHDGVDHVHFHSHEETKEHRHHHSMFAVGATHGLAGTASVMVIVPLTMSQSLVSAAAFLLLFGIGTILSMSIVATLIGKLTHSFDRANALTRFRFVAGCSSLCLGIAWIGMRVF